MKRSRSTPGRRSRTLAWVLAGLGLWLMTGSPVQAQGPYGRNSYEDFPFNQGSLFYRPLKPKPKPKVKVAPRTAVVPVQPQRRTYVQPRYYYYPANPAPAAPYGGYRSYYYVPQMPR